MNLVDFACLIARRRTADALRRKCAGRRAIQSFADRRAGSDDTGLTPEQLEAEELQMRVLAAVQGLPEQLREIVNQRFLRPGKRLTWQQLAEAFNVSIKQARTLIDKAFEQMQVDLKDVI